MHTNVQVCTYTYENTHTHTENMWSTAHRVSKVTPVALYAELVQTAGGQKEYFLFLV